MKSGYEERLYRLGHQPRGMGSFTVRAQESDLWIAADRPLKEQALRELLAQRRILESYIRENPAFASSLTPLPQDDLAPPMVRAMLQAGQSAGTGPMAAVAGIIAQLVGKALLLHCSRVVVENGGDLFLAAKEEMTVGLYAGSSPLSGKLGIKISQERMPLCMACSSGSVGHSLSLGIADAAVVVSRDGALADACATALGNRVKNPGDLEGALQWLQTVPGIEAGLVVLGDDLAAWGDMTLSEL